MKTGTTSLYPAWLVATVATLGSLYFSEVLNYVPCTFCWYQRILMYPLVVILGVAAYKQDRGVVKYALPLSLIGLGFSTYHYLEQKVPGFGAVGACKAGVPCSTQYINWLGFITIPLLAGVAFVLITFFLVRAAQRG